MPAVTASSRTSSCRTRIDHYIKAARGQDDMSGVPHVGIDETSVKRGHEYISMDMSAARGFRTVENFIAIAYLRMSKLKHLPANTMVRAIPLAVGHTIQAC